MDNSQLSDMQEMTMIYTQYKSLYLKAPTQSEVSLILKERKEIRESPQIPKAQTLKQLF